jgi:hypothetical protein
MDGWNDVWMDGMIDGTMDGSLGISDKRSEFQINARISDKRSEISDKRSAFQINARAERLSEIPSVYLK